MESHQKSSAHKTKKAETRSPVNEMNAHHAITDNRDIIDIVTSKKQCLVDHVTFGTSYTLGKQVAFD